MPLSGFRPDQTGKPAARWQRAFSAYPRRPDVRAGFPAPAASRQAAALRRRQRTTARPGRGAIVRRTENGIRPAPSGTDAENTLAANRRLRSLSGALDSRVATPPYRLRFQRKRQPSGGGQPDPPPVAARKLTNRRRTDSELFIVYLQYAAIVSQSLQFMKKFALLLLLTGCFVREIQAQTPKFPEPEFVGHISAVLPDTTTRQLVQESLTPRHRASTGAKLFGIGKTEIHEMILNGPKSASRLSIGNGIALIVRVMDNRIDPMSAINVFRFETKKKLRIAEYASVGTFGDLQSNTLQRQPFTARRFGTSSYMIVLQNPEPGEYGIKVNIPGNDLTVTTFGIDE